MTARAAFTITVTRAGGRRIIENVIVEHRDGRIVRQLEVEAGTDYFLQGYFAPEPDFVSWSVTFPSG